MEIGVGLNMRAIDDLVVVRRHAGTAEIDVGSTIALASSTGRVVQLDERGLLLWQLFDGEADLGTLSDELSEAFGESRDVVFSDLSAFVAEMMEMNLLVDADVDELAQHRSEDESGAQRTSLSVPEPCCGSELLDRHWLPTVALHVGDRVLGVRTDDPVVGSALRALLADSAVDEAVAEPNVSILFRLPAASDEAPALSMYVQGELVGRTPSAARIRDLLALYLTALASGSESKRLWLQAWPVGGPTGVVLVGPQLTGALAMLRPVLTRRRWSLGGAMASIDLRTLDVVIDRSKVAFSAEAARDFDRLSDWSHDGPDFLSDGRYPLRAFALVPPLPSDAVVVPGLPPGGLHDETRLLLAALPLIGGLAAYGVAPAVDDVLSLAQHIAVREPLADEVVDWLDEHLA